MNRSAGSSSTPTTVLFDVLCQLSALAGVTMNAEHPTTLQQLNDLDILTDVKVEVIMAISE